MAAVLLRLMALIALVLMPHGLASAPAHAQAAHYGVSADHCADQTDSDKAPASTQVDCAMACSALQAAEAPLQAPVIGPKGPRLLALVTPFAGVEPEIATPPPKLS